MWNLYLFVCLFVCLFVWWPHAQSGHSYEYNHYVGVSCMLGMMSSHHPILSCNFNNFETLAQHNVKSP